MATTSTAPIQPNRLKQICNDACDSALTGAANYDHSLTVQWNSAIINKILQSLISESTPSAPQPDESGEDKPAPSPKYKFAVNSTIIQHLADPRQTGESGESVSLGTDATKKVGRRGMHSASGAYWNNETDGMWSHKYEGGESKGMDIVISIIWIAC